MQTLVLSCVLISFKKEQPPREEDTDNLHGGQSGQAYFPEVVQSIVGQTQVCLGSTAGFQQPVLSVCLSVSWHDSPQPPLSL